MDFWEEDKFSTFILADSVFLMGRDGCYLEIWKAGKCLAEQPDKLIGKTIYDTLPKDVSELYDTAIKVTLDTQQSQCIEYELESKEGRRHFKACTALLPDWSQDSKQTILWLATDITDRKTIETQLIHTAKLVSLGNMATGIAHAINQHLQVIQIIVDMEIALAVDKDTTKLEKIVEEIANVKQITSKLRVYGGDNATTKKELHDINIIIHSACDLFRAQFEKEDIKLILKLTKVPDHYCNAIEIEQVFMHLLINAQEAMMHLEANKLIEISSFIKNNKIIIEFKDTGIGIAQSQINKVFDPFFTDKEVNEGEGLGLSISFGILKANNGNIRIKETSRNGTTFIIEITPHECIDS